VARHGAGVVLAPDYCVERRQQSKGPVSERDAGGGAEPLLIHALVDVLPGWRLLAGLDTVQALTLPMPAGSESARALVRFVRDALASH
jgi:hypothetical protein